MGAFYIAYAIIVASFVAGAVVLSIMGRQDWFCFMCGAFLLLLCGPTIKVKRK